jgi:hypothetical protein
MSLFVEVAVRTRITQSAVGIDQETIVHAYMKEHG